MDYNKAAQETRLKTNINPLPIPAPWLGQRRMADRTRRARAARTRLLSLEARCSCCFPVALVLEAATLAGLLDAPPFAPKIRAAFSMSEAPNIPFGPK